MEIRKRQHSHHHGHQCCGDDGHSHEHQLMGLGGRWLFSILIVVVLLWWLRPFIIAQMLVRVTSYSASALYPDAIRLCQKTIALDPGNIQARTSLGYAYLDMEDADAAMKAFNKVLELNPQDHGAVSFELGKLYYARKDWVHAIEYFERVKKAGPRAGVWLDADILKYRHGTLGFKNVNSMQTLLELLRNSYLKIGEPVKAAKIEQEYQHYKATHHSVLF